MQCVKSKPCHKEIYLSFFFLCYVKLGSKAINNPEIPENPEPF